MVFVDDLPTASALRALLLACFVSAAGVARADPLVLTAVPANGTVGLDWTRIPGARGYRVYWSRRPGVGPRTGARLDSQEPAMVHRGLRNSTRYHYVVTAIGAQGESAPSAEITAVPHGAWAIEEMGAGDFDDVLSGARVPRLAPRDRLQILLLPEGYGAADLKTFHDDRSHARRNNDVDRWIDEVFRVEPYTRFRSAFVVWYLPRASPAHLSEGRTAFQVKVSVTRQAVESVEGAAAPLWALLDGRGDEAFPFAGGVAANVVPAFLLFDPVRGQAGWSGMERPLVNPADRRRSLRAAFGVEHAHELGHAFAGLRDEYLANDAAPATAEEQSNVVPDNRCTELPWRHLLAGAGIQTSSGVVGAFGRAGLGFHSELTCLMNGTHDNGNYYCAPQSIGVYPALPLRAPDRLCNFCREMTAYQIFARTGLLAGPAGWARWKDHYRSRFYQRFGFQTPPAPARLACPGQTARTVFEVCARP